MRVSCECGDRHPVPSRTDEWLTVILPSTRESSSAGRSRSPLQGVGSLVQKVVVTLLHPCDEKLSVCKP